MNETLLYIILGILYLVFTALGRVAKKRQQKTQQEEPWSLDDALRDLQTSSEDQTEIAPAPVPPAPSDWSDAYIPTTPAPADLPPESSRFATPDFTAPVPQPAAKPKPQELPDPPRRSSPDAPAVIIRHLRDPKSAQTAIILSEILGPPKGARRFPRPRLYR